MKLSGQVSQYWTNLENKRAAQGQSLIDTWYRMKEELKTKYVPLSFNAHLMDNWHEYAQGNKSAEEYVEKFDEFPIRNEKLKFFLNSESALEMTHELNC